MVVTLPGTTMVMADGAYAIAVEILNELSGNHFRGRMNPHLAVDADDAVNMLGNKTQIMGNNKNGHPFAQLF
jgi:hypothetical protein